MKAIFFNQQNKLRNGWKILLFLANFITVYVFSSYAYSHIVSLPYNLIVDKFLFLISVIISTLIMMHFFENKCLLEIGLKFTSSRTYDIFLGLLLGLVMITIVVIPNIALDYYRYDFVPNQAFPQIFEYVFLFLLVAFSEETLFRGYPFQRLIDGTNPTFATLLFSLIFSIAHFFNPNVTLFSLLNIFLAGIFLSVAYIKTRSLWLPISLHFSWNFFQGYLYSLPVSGAKLTEPLFNVEIYAENIISGGDFGPEGSLITSIVLIASTIFIFKNKRISR